MERLKIDTPEQVALELPTAGVGSRFLAVAVDTVLQLVLALLVFLVSTIQGPRAILTHVGPVFGILASFCIYWGYFAVFETAWSGQTPGKRLARIRVIGGTGRPVTGYQAIARNVVRAIDFLPAMYGVGIVTMLLNRYSRRIGDYVAGTVVVHDLLATGGLTTDTTARPSVTGRSIVTMTDDELQVIEAYLRRRRDLDVFVADDMAARIVQRVTRRTGLAPAPGTSVDEFLEDVARRVRDSARFR